MKEKDVKRNSQFKVYKEKKLVFKIFLYNSLNQIKFIKISLNKCTIQHHFIFAKLINKMLVQNEAREKDPDPTRSEKITFPPPGLSL